jgi:ubiquitin carboxyl-terminal hydrolase 5/13
MASIFQVLFKIPEFIDRYYKQHDALIQSSHFNEVPKDFHVQLSKLAHGLLSGEFSKPEEKPENEGIYIPLKVVKPTLLKSIIGEGNQEFASNRQQDAAEFFQYFLQLTERKERSRGDGSNPSAVFKFSIEERLECSTSHSVKYSIVDKQISLSLPIPVEKASNLVEVEAYNQREAKKTPEQKKKKLIGELLNSPSILGLA